MFTSSNTQGLWGINMSPPSLCAAAAKYLLLNTEHFAGGGVQIQKGRWWGGAWPSLHPEQLPPSLRVQGYIWEASRVLLACPSKGSGSDICSGS